VRDDEPGRVARAGLAATFLLAWLLVRYARRGFRNGGTILRLRGLGEHGVWGGGNTRRNFRDEAPIIRTERRGK